MGCGGSKKDRRQSIDVARPMLMLNSIRPEREGLLRERSSKLPLVVLEGLAKVLQHTGKGRIRRRVHPRKYQDPNDLFENRILGSLHTLQTASTVITSELTYPTYRKSDQWRESAQQFEDLLPSPMKALSPELIKPLDLKGAVLPIDSEPFGAVSSSTSRPSDSKQANPYSWIGEKQPMEVGSLGYEEGVIGVEDEVGREGGSVEIRAGLGGGMQGELGESEEERQLLGNQPSNTGQFFQDQLFLESSISHLAEPRTTEERPLATTESCLDGHSGEAVSTLSKYQ